VAVKVYAVVDTSLSPTFPLGDAFPVYVRRERRRALHRGGHGRRAATRGGSSDWGARARDRRARL